MYSPLKKAYITQGFHLGYAIDLGWISFGISYPPIHAFYDSVVVGAWYERAGGNCVMLRTPLDDTSDILTQYAHLHRIDVKVGDRIVGDQVIGLGGNTGYYRSGGVEKRVGMHLHYEVWVVPKNFVFSTSNYWHHRSKYIVNPFNMFNGNGIDSRNIGGLKMFTMDKEMLGRVIPTHRGLRIRTQPNTAATTPVLGTMEEPMVTTGKVKGKHDGHEWYQVILNDRPGYVAAAFVKFEAAAQVKEVIKTVQVERPVNVNVVSEGLAISVKNAK